MSNDSCLLYSMDRQYGNGLLVPCVSMVMVDLVLSPCILTLLYTGSASCHQVFLS